MKDFYWGDESLGEENADSLVNAISDSSYAHPIDTASKIHFMRSSDPVSIAGFYEMVTCEPKFGKHQSLAHVVCFRSMCITSRTEENTR